MKVLFTAILMAIYGSLFAQNYNLGFEQWNGTFTKEMPGPDSCNIPLDFANNNLENRLPNWTVSLGLFRTTDANSGNYAAVVCTWYFGNTGVLSFGSDCGGQVCKYHFDTKIFGVSGYYKYNPNAVHPTDTVKKKAIAYLKTFKKDSITGGLEVLSFDSLKFSKTDSYTYFQITTHISDSTIIPDSVSLWFQSKNYSSIGDVYGTYCPFAHFLYLDDLEFHFDPMSTTSIKENPLKKKLKIFPNPAKSTLQLQYRDLKIQRLTLTDLSGRVIKIFPAGSKMLDVSGIAAGLYFLQVEAEEGKTAEKVEIR